MDVIAGESTEHCADIEEKKESKNSLLENFRKTASLVSHELDSVPL